MKRFPELPLQARVCIAAEESPELDLYPSTYTPVPLAYHTEKKNPTFPPWLSPGPHSFPLCLLNGLQSLQRLCSFFFPEREREENHQPTPHGVYSHNPEIMTYAEIMNRMFNQLSHPSTLPLLFLERTMHTPASGLCPLCSSLPAPVSSPQQALSILTHYPRITTFPSLYPTFSVHLLLSDII